MPTHWTYKSFEPGDGLFQGDIIARDPLLEVLRAVHGHFCDPKYLAFVVVTQTCDLVVRKGRCKAKHISLAVVRSLASVLPDLLEEICNGPAPGVFSLESRVEAEQFLHRILNQNEQAHGMVYLHPDGDVGIGEPAVALLRVSISLRAKEHYDRLRSARIGRMDTEYRNKLGWLAGNLYSRVDTTDWAEKDRGEETEKAIIKDLLDGPSDGRMPLWLPSSWLEAARKKKVDFKNLPPEELAARIREAAPQPPLDVAIAEVKRPAGVLQTDFVPEPAASFNEKVAADSCLLPLLRPVIVATSEACLGDLPAPQRLAFIDVAAGDDYLRGQVAAAIQAVANAFLSRKGPPKLDLLVQELQQMKAFPAGAVGHLEGLAEENFGGAYLARKDAVDATFAAVPIPPSLIEHLRYVAHFSIQESLIDRLGRRLGNSVPFKNSIRES